MQVPEVRCLRKMINDIPVVAAPAEIDITAAEQLGAVLLTAAGGGHPAVVMDDTSEPGARPGEGQVVTAR